MEKDPQQPIEISGVGELKNVLGMKWGGGGWKGFVLA